MNCKNNETFDPHRLKRSDKYVAFSKLSIYYTWKIKKSYKKSKFKISAPTWNGVFELPGGSYSRLFWIFLKKHEEKSDNSSIRIYINKIENRITFNIKTRYYL